MAKLGSETVIEILQQLIAEIPWGHNLLILNKLSDPAARLYYLRAAIIGPTASMIPDAFFRRGISVMAGVRISDPEKMSGILKQGGSAYHLLRECCEKIAFVVSPDYLS